MDDLDALDRRIMYELDLNARAPASELAKKLRKSKETVNFRLRRLLDGGYLKGFYAVFSTSKLGWYYYKVYLKFKNITPDKESELFAYIRGQANIAYLADVEGYYDCVLLVMVRNSQEMTDFLYPFMKLYGAFVQEKDLVVFLTTHRLNQRFLFAGEERADWFYPVMMENYEVDETDRRILGTLSSNARMPFTEIAKKTGIDPKVVKYRLKKLEKDGIVLAYVTSPGFDKLGLLFIQLNISLKDPTTKKSIIEYFSSTDRCLFAIELLGKYDLTIEIHVKDNAELKAIIDGFRTKFVDVYNDYDVSVINQEHVVVWSPFPNK